MPFMPFMCSCFFVLSFDQSIDQSINSMLPYVGIRVEVGVRIAAEIEIEMSMSNVKITQHRRHGQIVGT